MKTYKFPRTGETVYCEKLANDFNVVVIPMKNKNNYYALLGVKYGSKDLEFIPVGKEEYLKTNLGIAHFLEHKVFEMEEGENPFSFFAESGTGANASTGFESTRYYIWGTDKFRENLDYLLTYVFSPYFTDENIKKEQGIISQEIKMYDDEPGWIIDDLSRKMAFNNSPVREKIAGTLESISKITKEELYDCYNTFYVPNNMYLVVCGNVSQEEVLEIVNNNKALKKHKPNYDIKRKEYHESDAVNMEYKALNLNIYVPKVKYLFKINRDKISLKDELKIDMYLNIINSVLFGSTSEFCEKVHNEEIANYYYSDFAKYDNYYILGFVAETDKADIFKDEVDKCLKNIEITSDELERMKRVWIASEIKMTDSCDLLSENLFEDLVTYNHLVIERIDIIESLNIKDLNKVVKTLDFEHNCFILANPKDKNI